MRDSFHSIKKVSIMPPEWTLEPIFKIKIVQIFAIIDKRINQLLKKIPKKRISYWSGSSRKFLTT